jgi:alpha-D-ribose 1-methylphosphonate 5-triphosphate synthase subunit PhnG
MDQQTDRQRWMSILAKAEPEQLELHVRDLEPLPSYQLLRSPEIGLAMVRGRAGGSGQPFNLGEITMTRCVVQLDLAPDETPVTGFGYVAGRSRRHAELAALCDALLQCPNWQPRVQTAVITPLQTQRQHQRDRQQRQTAATTVNFYTLVREKEKG